MKQKTSRTLKSGEPRTDPIPTRPAWADWPRLWLEMLFLSALIAIPLSFHPATSHTIVIKDFLAQFYALNFLLLGGALLIRERFWSTAPKSIWIPLLLYVLYGTARAFQSPYLEHSWTQWAITLSGISAIIPAYLVFQRESSASRALWVLGAVAAMVSIYAGFQFAAALTGVKGIDPVNWAWDSAPIVGSFLRFADTNLEKMEWERFEGFGPLPGACSTLGNPNFFAGFLIPLFGLFAGLSLWKLFTRSDKEKSRKWLGISAPILVYVLVLLAILMAGSRGGLLGMGGVAVGVLLLYGGVLLRKGERVYGLASIGMGLAIALVISCTLFVLFWPANRESAEQTFGSVENRSIVYRCTSWLIRDHFFIGVTPGNFTIRFPYYLTGPEAEQYGWLEAPEEKVLEHAHSEYLEIWSDLGVVGLILWLATLIGFFRFLWWGLRSFEQPFSRWLILGIAVGVLGALFQNLISVSLRWVASAWIFWTFIGAGTGWVVGKFATQNGRSKPLPFWIVPMTFLLAMILFLPNTKRWAADWHFVRGRDLLQHGSPKAEEELQRTIELNPRFPQSYYLLAGHYYTNSRFEDAIENYKKVQQLRGNVVVLTENLATSYFKLSTTLEQEADREEALLTAIELYEGSLERHPTFPRLYDYLSRAY
ncbi:MAG: O-antigen ligase family protein, partial [Candidatus Omnitrophica bacterium]|nr:O-antigen ligase family protein [Candidatus Omnitrophota bacterium]